ncbi:hypothetical protein [Vibrio viridaestus]|uniref:hypothetical protein n=1 Tax=Vibrio viridaestus TaxID=2487322 RepID=UPI000F611DF9|nr:hypothetical protein [Vibrio viridaestus]
MAAVLTLAKKQSQRNKSQLISGLSVIILLAVSGQCAAAENEQDTKYDLSSYTAEQAYDAGRLMRAQFKDSMARPYLKYSADKGNANSAYLYAMDIVSSNPNAETPELAREYLIKAANEGQLDATYYLYKNGTWFRNATRLKYRNSYHDGSIELAESDPGKASFNLYRYYSDLNNKKSSYYLKKSQQYLYAPAVLQSSIASFDEQSNPKLNSKFIRDVEFIANKGYMPALRACVDYYEEKNKFDQALEWKEEALNYGDLMSLASLAKIYAGMVPSYSFVKTDLIKSYAYLSMYIDSAGKNRFSHLYSMMENLYSDISEKMTKEQKDKANALINKFKEKQVIFYNYDLLWNS